MTLTERIARAHARLVKFDEAFNARALKIEANVQQGFKKAATAVSKPFKALSGAIGHAIPVDTRIKARWVSRKAYRATRGYVVKNAKRLVNTIRSYRPSHAEIIELFRLKEGFVWNDSDFDDNYKKFLRGDKEEVIRRLRHIKDQPKPVETIVKTIKHTANIMANSPLRAWTPEEMHACGHRNKEQSNDEAYASPYIYYAYYHPSTTTSYANGWPSKVKKGKPRLVVIIHDGYDILNKNYYFPKAGMQKTSPRFLMEFDIYPTGALGVRTIKINGKKTRRSRNKIFTALNYGGLLTGQIFTDEQYDPKGALKVAKAHNTEKPVEPIRWNRLKLLKMRFDEFRR